MKAPKIFIVSMLEILSDCAIVSIKETNRSEQDARCFKGCV